MRTRTITQNGVGVHNWFRVDYKKANFMVGWKLSAHQNNVAADLAGSILAGWSDPSVDVVPCTVTRSGTTATLISANPAFLTANTGDWVVLNGSQAPFQNQFQITNTAGVITFTVANSGPTQSDPGCTATLIRQVKVLDWVLATPPTMTADSKNVVFPYNYITVSITAATGDGTAALTIVQGAK